MSALNSQTITYEQLARVLDHSLLRPELIDADVIAGCQLADRCQTTTVYVKPCHVKLASETLKDSTVKVGTTVGFPHGAHITSVNVAEARQAIDDRAVELDMVLNIGNLRSGKADAVCADIRAVCDTAHERGAKVKVFLENAYLTDRQKVLGCKLAEEADADRGKTSTGFASSGATLHDLRLVRRSWSEKVEIKAAGGVRILAALLDVKDARANRCGTTATAAILDAFKVARRKTCRSLPRVDVIPKFY